ncbi:40S ribosomal protein S5-1 [Hordeum vulgare]|nr:40S ribosomal protein S5-1 [Hordeum vulgare]
MREGMLHIRDVEGPKKIGSVETRLEAMEQQVFKCQGMVERGLNANHMVITEFTNKHRIDANDIGKHLSRLYDMIDQLQGQIYDLQNQNCDGLARYINFLHEEEERHAEHAKRLTIVVAATMMWNKEIYPKFHRFEEAHQEQRRAAAEGDGFDSSSSSVGSSSSAAY